jgi:hypothetical protein
MKLNIFSLDNLIHVAEPVLFRGCQNHVTRAPLAMTISSPRTWLVIRGTRRDTETSSATTRPLDQPIANPTISSSSTSRAFAHQRLSTLRQVIIAPMNQKSGLAFLLPPTVLPGADTETRGPSAHQTLIASRRIEALTARLPAICSSLSLWALLVSVYMLLCLE